MNPNDMFASSYDRMKLLGLELVSVCEAAAAASACWIGRGDKHEADAAATEAMRTLLNGLPMTGTVVIGEGELDEAPMLYIGERLGNGMGPAVDIAVDPLEGTGPVSDGQGNALSVIAAAPRGTLLHAPDIYMEKLAVGPEAAGCIDITQPIAVNAARVAAALHKPMDELTVMIQSRPRHRQAIDSLRTAGAKVLTFQEGDVSCAVAVALSGKEVDLFYGIGGAPEGVLAAVALKCLGGEMQARLLPESDDQLERCRRMGIADVSRPLATDDMVRSDECVFVATGVTDSFILDGVRRKNGRWLTHTLLAFGRKRQVYFLKNLAEHQHPGAVPGAKRGKETACLF